MEVAICSLKYNSLAYLNFLMVEHLHSLTVSRVMNFTFLSAKPTIERIMAYILLLLHKGEGCEDLCDHR